MKNYGMSRMIRSLVVSAGVLVILIYLSTGRRIFGYSLPSILETNAVLLYVIEIVLALVAIIANIQIIISGFVSVLRREPNTDSLVSLGALAAFMYSAVIFVQNIYFYGNMGEYIGRSEIYFETCVLILTFVLIGKILEEKAKGRTTDAISALIDISPTTALIKSGDGEKEVDISEVKVGDIFILKPGMRVPVDGIIESGSSAIDESSLTGESIPVDKTVGMRVSAATINTSGYLTCRATQVGEDTAFSHIIQMVTDAALSKDKDSSVENKITGIVIVVVFIAALLTFLVWSIAGMGLGFALARSISVLIISCPCALGLASPIAVMIGSSIGAKNGILYKSSKALKDAGNIQIAVVDKTGTITTGEPKVTDIISTVKDIEHRDLLLTVAYSLEAKSEHPLSKAICKFAKRRFITPKETTNFVAVPGKGISADILLNGKAHKVFAGNESYIAGVLLGTKDEEARFDSEFSEIIKKLVGEGKTPIIFSTQKGLLGVIAVADEIRESSREAVTCFHGDDIHVVMVTGDRYVTARAVGAEVGIGEKEVLSEVLPKDKAEIVKELCKTGKVAMIGDGINDAPALTCADLGIAIGAGTDVAIDAADVVLTKNNLIDAFNAVKLSKNTGTIIRQNMFIIFAYYILGIPLAAGVFYRSIGLIVNPVFCSAAMLISTILVIVNAFRLYGFTAVEAEDLDDDDV